MWGFPIYTFLLEKVTGKEDSLKTTFGVKVGQRSRVGGVAGATGDPEMWGDWRGRFR